MGATYFCKFLSAKEPKFIITDKKAEVHYDKNKEKLVQEKTEKINDKIKSYIDEMDKLSEIKQFTIDNIEKMWGKLEDYTRAVLT